MGWGGEGGESLRGLRALPKPQHPPGHIKELRMMQRVPGLLHPGRVGDHCRRGAASSPGRMKMLKTAASTLDFTEPAKPKRPVGNQQH